MRKIKTILFLFPFILFACNNSTGETKEKDSTAVVPQWQKPQTVFDIEPNLVKADSLQILYYDNPDGDSLRYTRFFNLAETTDTAQINTLVSEMNGVYVQEPNARICRSQGKLFLLRNEDVLKTVYFSTRGDSCRYFYFIRDGAFFYFPMTKKAEEILQDNKQLARKP